MALTVPAPVHDLDVHDLDRQSYHQDDDGWEDFPLFPRDGKTDLAPNKNDDAVDDSDDDDRPGVLGEFPPVGSNDLPSTSSDAFRKVSRLSDQSHSLFFRNINDKVTVQYPNQSPKSSLVRSATQEKEQTPAQTNSKRVSDRLSENNAKKLRRSLHSKSTLLVSSQYVIDEKIDKEVGETKKKTDTDQRGSHSAKSPQYPNRAFGQTRRPILYIPHNRIHPQILIPAPPYAQYSAITSQHMVVSGHERWTSDAQPLNYGTHQHGHSPYLQTRAEPNVLTPESFGFPSPVGDPIPVPISPMPVLNQPIDPISQYNLGNYEGFPSPFSLQPQGVQEQPSITEPRENLVPICPDYFPVDSHRISNQQYSPAPNSLEAHPFPMVPGLLPPEPQEQILPSLPLASSSSLPFVTSSNEFFAVPPQLFPVQAGANPAPMLQQRMAEAAQNLPNTLSPMEPSSEFTLEAVEPHLKNIHPDDFDKKLTDIMCTFLTREYEQTIQTIFERFRYSNVNRRCPDTQKSILSTAIDNELSSTFIHRLLLNNADPCLADPDGQIMLTKFIRRKLDKEYIQRLSHRCIDTPDKHGRLPLWWAVEVFCKDYVLQHVHGARKLVSGLLHQARAADDKGITPLMIASSYKSKNMVAALLADVHGPCASDVDAVCKHGKTALIYAVSSSDNFANTKAIIQQLLSAGANSSITDDTGKSAAEYCPNKLVYLITSRKKQNGSK